MAQSDDGSPRDALVLAEAHETMRRYVTQAWDQSRHIEALRTQYLGLLFSLIIAVPGIVIALSLSKGSDPAQSIPLMVVAGWSIVGLILLTAFVLAASRRWGVVLGHYRSVIWDFTKDQLNGVDFDPSRWAKRVDVPTSRGELVRTSPDFGGLGSSRRPLGVHDSLDVLLRAVLALAFLGLFAVDGQLVALGAGSLVYILCSAQLVFAFAGTVALLRSRKT